MSDDLDPIFKALSDPTRREILDLLRESTKTTTEIVDQFQDLSRFAVMKHMQVLRDANLLITHAEGRRRIHTLNAAPIRMISERWISQFDSFWANVLLRTKESSEEQR